MAEFKTEESCIINGRSYYGFTIGEKDNLIGIDEEIEKGMIKPEFIREGNIIQLKLMRTSSTTMRIPLVVKYMKKSDKRKRNIVLSDMGSTPYREFEKFRSPYNQKLKITLKIGDSKIKDKIDSYYTLLNESTPAKDVFPLSIYSIPDRILVRKYNIREQFVHMEI